MSGTDDAINQGIVLASILTGFAFVIAGQFGQQRSKIEQSEQLAYGFFFVALFCLAAVAVGILYFANDQEGGDQSLLSAFFFLFLAIGGVIFLYTMSELIRWNIQEQRERRDLLFVIILFAVLLFILTLGTSPHRTEPGTSKRIPCFVSSGSSHSCASLPCTPASTASASPIRANTHPTKSADPAPGSRPRSYASGSWPAMETLGRCALTQKHSR